MSSEDAVGSSDTLHYESTVPPEASLEANSGEAALSVKSGEASAASTSISSAAQWEDKTTADGVKARAEDSELVTEEIPMDDDSTLTTASPVKESLEENLPAEEDEASDDLDDARDDLDEASTEIIAKNLRSAGMSIDDETAGLMSREILDMDIFRERDLNNQTELNRKTRQFGNQQFSFQQQNQFFNPQQFQNQGQVNQRFTSPGFQNRVPSATSNQFGGQFATQPQQQEAFPSQPGQFSSQPQQAASFSTQPQQAAPFGTQPQQATQFNGQPQPAAQFGGQPKLLAGQITQQLGQALFGQNPTSPARQQQQFNNNPSAQSFQPFQQATVPQQQFQQTTSQQFLPAAIDSQFQRPATGAAAFQSTPTQQFQQASQQPFPLFQSSPLQSFQDLSGSVQQQSTLRPLLTGTPTPSPAFQSFPAQEEIPVHVRPVGIPTSQPSKIFTLEGFDFTAPELDELLRTDNSLGTGAEAREEGEQPQFLARPANARPPPNADPRHKGTTPKPQVSVSSNSSAQDDLVPSDPIPQLWNQLFSGESISQIIEQERPVQLCRSRNFPLL
jgi:hypothetical protein